MKKSSSILKHLMSLFILVFVMTGCDMMNVGVKDFLLKYTETAAVEVIKFNGTYDFDASGKRCLSCQRDQSVTLMLRNPQKYQLDINFVLDYSLDIFSLEKGNHYFITSNSDCTEVTLTFNKDFLKLYETESPVDGYFNLDGKITLYEPSSGRYFDEYRIEWVDNSTPPAVENLLLNLTQAENGNYVLCFFLPEISRKVNDNHFNDTKKLVITENETEKVYYFKYNADVSPSTLKFYTDSLMENESTDIVQNASGFPNLTGLNETQTVFSALQVPPETKACYYEVTSSTPSTDREDKFSVKIIDDAGLYSDVKISNKASKLKPVTFNVDNDQTYSAAELSNTKTILFNHDLQDEDGNYVDSVTIEYKVYLSNDGTNYSLDQSGSLVRNMAVTPSIELPPAKNYKIEAYARKDYYVKSDTKDVKFNVSRSPNYYISQSGNDDISAGGTLLKPYYSINKCVSEIGEEINNYGINSAGYNIYLLTNLTAVENDNFEYHIKNAFAWVEYDSRIAAKATEVNPFKLTISGYNGNKTINFNRNSTNKGIGLYFEYNKNTEYILNNLTLTGAYHDQKGAVVFVSNYGHGLNDPVTATDCQLTLINTTITGNTIECTDEVVFQGAGVYFVGPGQLNLSGAVKIYNNKIINNAGSDTEVMTANNLFIGLSQENTGVQNNVIIKGSLAGSNIGIRTDKRPGSAHSMPPSIPFTSDYGYKAGGRHAGINPETYFTGDLDFIGVNEAGEVCVEVEHGEVQGDTINEELEISIKDFAETYKSSDKPQLQIETLSGKQLSSTDLDSIEITIKDNFTVVKKITNTLTLDLSNCIFGESKRTYQVDVIVKYNGQGYNQLLNLTVTNE